MTRLFLRTHGVSGGPFHPSEAIFLPAAPISWTSQCPSIFLTTRAWHTGDVGGGTREVALDICWCCFTILVSLTFTLSQTFKKRNREADSPLGSLGLRVRKRVVLSGHYSVSE